MDIGLVPCEISGFVFSSLRLLDTGCLFSNHTPALLGSLVDAFSLACQGARCQHVHRGNEALD